MVKRYLIVFGGILFVCVFAWNIYLFSLPHDNNSADYLNYVAYSLAILCGAVMAATIAFFVRNDSLEQRVRERTANLQESLREKEEAEKILEKRSAELTKAYQELKELDTTKSEFISVAAHQLRTPLSGVKWTLSLLLNGDLGPITADQKTYIEKTAESNNKIISLVNDLLSADKIQSDKAEYEFVSTDLGSLIGEAVSEFALVSERKKVKLSFTKESDLPNLFVDTHMMHGVFQNLIDNAIKYTKAGGAVTLSVYKKGDMVEATISDTGIGVPEDQKKHIFERFFRGRNAIKMEPDGTGLGLFIVKQIIVNHGGTVQFESQEDKGTTFVIQFPVKRKME